MFRAISCSSSGGQIVLTQHLVSSLSVNDRPVHSLRENSLNLCTGRSLTESDDNRCCINAILPPEDEQDIARNMYMYRTVINVLKICASSWSLAKVIIYFVCDWRDNLQWARSSSFTRFLDHTRRRTTVGRAPLEENITLLCLHNISVTSSWHYSALTVTHTIWELCEHEYVDRV